MALKRDERRFPRGEGKSSSSLLMVEAVVLINQRQTEEKFRILKFGSIESNRKVQRRSIDRPDSISFPGRTPPGRPTELETKTKNLDIVPWRRTFSEIFDQQVPVAEMNVDFGLSNGRFLFSKLFFVEVDRLKKSSRSVSLFRSTNHL